MGLGDTRRQPGRATFPHPGWQAALPPLPPTKIQGEGCEPSQKEPKTFRARLVDPGAEDWPPRAFLPGEEGDGLCSDTGARAAQGLISITNRTDRNFKQPNNSGGEGEEAKAKLLAFLPPAARQDRSHSSSPVLPQLPPGTRAGCSNTQEELQVVIFAIRNPDLSPQWLESFTPAPAVNVYSQRGAVGTRLPRTAESRLVSATLGFSPARGFMGIHPRRTLWMPSEPQGICIQLKGYLKK